MKTTYEIRFKITAYGSQEIITKSYKYKDFAKAITFRNFLFDILNNLEYAKKYEDNILKYIWNGRLFCIEGIYKIIETLVA